MPICKRLLVVLSLLILGYTPHLSVAQAIPPAKEIDLVAGCTEDLCIRIYDSVKHDYFTSGEKFGPQASSFSVSGGLIDFKAGDKISLYPPSDALRWGFTVAVKVNGLMAEPVETVFSLVDRRNNALFTLFRQDGGRWFVGKMRDRTLDSTAPRLYFTAETWDPVSPCTQKQVRF
jgi:hypothetical protein